MYHFSSEHLTLFQKQSVVPSKALVFTVCISCDYFYINSLKTIPARKIRLFSNFTFFIVSSKIVSNPVYNCYVSVEF